MQRKQQKTWTIKEIKFIQDNYTNMTITEMAKFLGRSYGSVKNKVLYMGLKRTTERETKEYAYYVGDELVWEYKTESVNNFLRTYSRISSDLLNRMGKDGWELVMLYRGELVFKRKRSTK